MSSINTNPKQGLSNAEVAQSRSRYGNNIITPPKEEPIWKLFLEKFNDPIIKILLFAAIISFGIALIERDFAETIGIVVAIVLATGVSFAFEYDAARRFKVLNKVNDQISVKVLREGTVMEVPRSEVVVGDIVVLQNGEEVPADGILLSAVSVQVNESALTGELVASKTTDEKLFDTEATYPSNKVMRGTLLVEGYATMMAEQVGDQTEYGKVAAQSTMQNNEKTPLSKQLEKLATLIGKIGTAVSILVFVVLVLKEHFIVGDLFSQGWLHATSRLLEFFMISIALMIMSIPEGLPMSITLSLAMSMRKMLKTNNLVRKMHACETMGAVTVICTDKTGTLTQNQMSVHQMHLLSDKSNDLNRNIALNSTAFIDSENKMIGNPTEGALLLWLKSKGSDYEHIRKENQIIDQITFSTERKFMATLLGDGTLLVKGAPEVVLSMCDLDIEQESVITQKLDEYQNKAMRTLAFAEFKSQEARTCDDILQAEKLQMVAIAAISDPVREQVPGAVADCLRAGIKIKMVTGDTSKTAIQIAKEIGLWNDAEDSIERNHLSGSEFEALSDEQLLDRICELKVLSRARPLDKLRLVRLLQSQDEVVAVTGDGTNDAPALNYAQVGLSMGSGTSVAKGASDITLLDDSFSSIVMAVKWGRSLYKNIQRFVLFQLTVNFVALTIVFIGSIFYGELLLTVTQILWVNLIMDTFAAMALASLPPSDKVMKDKPRSKDDFIINRAMIGSILGIGSVCILALLGILWFYKGPSESYHLSVFFTVFVILQFWNLFNAKSFGSGESVFAKLRHSYGFLFILLCIFVGQVLIVSFGGDVFRVEPLELKDWVLITLLSSMIMWGKELLRLIFEIKK